MVTAGKMAQGSGISAHEMARANFGEEVVNAMHELAELIFASRVLAEAAKEFRLHEDIDFGKAAPEARKLSKTLRRISAALLKELQKGQRATLDERLNEVRRSNAKWIARASHRAASLSAARIEAYANQLPGGPERDHLVQQLQRRLERLATAWAAL